MPVDDVRHSLYRFHSVVEVVRLIVQQPLTEKTPSSADGKVTLEAFLFSCIYLRLKKKCSFIGTTTPKSQIPKVVKEESDPIISTKDQPPSPIRITLASLDEFNSLLQNGLDFYGATFFPTEANLPLTAAKIATKRGR